MPAFEMLPAVSSSPNFLLASAILYSQADAGSAAAACAK